MKNKPLIAVMTMLVVVALLASAPAIAGSVADYARNAGKVDGIHAVRASAGVDARAGKLVATNPAGYLPGGIVQTVPNARRVQGFTPDRIVRAGERVSSGHIENFHSRGFAGVHRSSVTAPGRGILLLWGQFPVEWDPDSEPGSYTSLAATFAVDDEQVGVPQLVEVERGTRRGTIAVSVQAAVPVDRGRHKVALQLRRTAGNALVRVLPRHIQSLFVPFGDGGVRGEL